MISVGQILNLLELVVFSGHIVGEQPVSALVTALVEAGKTELVMKFAQNEGCVALSEVWLNSYTCQGDIAGRQASLVSHGLHVKYVANIL